MEGIALRWLHLDSVALPDAGFELQIRDGVSLRPPPHSELLRIGERFKDHRSSGRQNALDLEHEPLRTRCRPRVMRLSHGRERAYRRFRSPKAQLCRA
jgi:hypothetical protein